MRFYFSMLARSKDRTQIHHTPAIVEADNGDEANGIAMRAVKHLYPLTDWCDHHVVGTSTDDPITRQNVESRILTAPDI